MGRKRFDSTSFLSKMGKGFVLGVLRPVIGRQWSAALPLPLPSRLHPLWPPGRFEAIGEISPAAWGQVRTLTTARSPAVGVQAIPNDAATAGPICFWSSRSS